MLISHPTFSGMDSLRSVTKASVILRKILHLGLVNRVPNYPRKVKLSLIQCLFSILDSIETDLVNRTPGDSTKNEKYLASHEGIQIDWDPALVFLVKKCLTIWQANLTMENE